MAFYAHHTKPPGKLHRAPQSRGWTDGRTSVGRSTRPASLHAAPAARPKRAPKPDDPTSVIPNTHAMRVLHRLKNRNAGDKKENPETSHPQKNYLHISY